MSTGYRDKALTPDERMERLEDAVAKISVRKVLAQLRWGIIILLAGVGIGALTYGIMLAVNAKAEAASAAHARDATDRGRLRTECREAVTNVWARTVRVDWDDHPSGLGPGKPGPVIGMAILATGYVTRLGESL